MKPAEWPALATTNAGWLRHVNRAVSLLIVVVLLTLLFRAGRDILAEGERMALDLAEQNLENLVWLEGKRVAAEEGVGGLERRAGSDPRAWAQGEVVYRVAWLAGGDRRWRVAVYRDDAGTSTPGLARDLLLVRVAPPDPGS